VPVSQDGEDVLVRVRAQPRARATEVAGIRDGALVVRVAAPPVEGRANDAIRRAVAKAAGVPQSRVELVRGGTARDKLLRLRGADAAAVASRFGVA
jgi:uncharacterized protein (TIGR00251 family)